MKEELLKMLENNPEMLRELLKENPKLKEAIKQVLKQPREKTLKDKLNKWGITEIPQEFIEALPVIESFLSWLDNEIQTRTAGQKGLHFSLRPLTKKESQDQE